MKKWWIPVGASLSVCVLSGALWYVEDASRQRQEDKLQAVQDSTAAAHLRVVQYNSAVHNASGTANAYVLPDGVNSPAALQWLQSEQQKTGVEVTSATLGPVDASAQKLTWIGKGKSDLPAGIGMEQLSLTVHASDTAVTKLLQDIAHGARYMQVETLSVSHADGAQETANLQVLIAYRQAH